MATLDDVQTWQHQEQPLALVLDELVVPEIRDERGQGGGHAEPQSLPNTGEGRIRLGCLRPPVDAYPSLTYRDVDSALEFLGRAFGLEPLGFGEAARHPEGNLWSFGYQRTESEG